MAVTRRYQMLRPVPCCCLLLSMRRIYWHGIVPFTTTCTDLYLSSRREGYIHVRANSSIEWVNEWGVNYGQVGSGYVPVANRLFSHPTLRASRQCYAILSVASARKGNIWLVMQRMVESWDGLLGNHDALAALAAVVLNAGWSRSLNNTANRRIVDFTIPTQDHSPPTTTPTSPPFAPAACAHPVAHAFTRSDRARLCDNHPPFTAALIFSLANQRRRCPHGQARIPRQHPRPV